MIALVVLAFVLGLALGAGAGAYLAVIWLSDGGPERWASCTSCAAGSAWYAGSAAAPRVARTEVAPGIEVSTVFLGMDHGWGPGPALLWETLTFGSPLDGEMRRYTSREEALAGHAEMVARVKEAMLGSVPAAPGSSVRDDGADRGG